MTKPRLHTLGLVLNGATGRMGTNQHLLRSILPIIRQGGVALPSGDRIMPEPLLAGRNPQKLAALAAQAGGLKWTTDLDTALADPAYPVYFDAQGTLPRAAAIARAIRAGRHIYCEKPSAATTREAYALYQLARKAGVRHGVVQDKLWLPGFRKLKALLDRGFFGRVLAVRGEFGYWVFEGDTIPAQRPSWNYRREEGGGIILDMLCHWRYLLDNLFGPVKAVSCLGATHIDRRVDESGRAYACTADDAAYATFELANGVICHFNASWCTRVRRDDLLTVQVDGTAGSAVAGLRDVWIQPYGATPRPVWNPDIPQTVDFHAGWQKLPDQQDYENAFKAQWECFLRHVVAGEPFPWTLLEGAKGVQLAEKGLESWRRRKWVSLPELKP